MLFDNSATRALPAMNITASRMSTTAAAKQLCQCQRGINPPKLGALPNCRASLIALPVRPHVNALSAALAALGTLLEPRHLDVIGIVRHVDQRLMAARILVQKPIRC
jgi:hypothetical protein